MNYAGKFDAALSLDGLGSRVPADGHADSFVAKPFIAKGHGHVPDGAFVVPDANLIFNGEFKRAGVDLVLSHDGHDFVVHDYFRGDKRAAIASPDGAHLTGDVVNALTGHVQYAQAAPGASAAQVIGHVTKLSGSATAVRNGVSVILNNGDNVEKGDVVSTGGDSTLGITFIDGTVFGLSSNARMVLNEMVYDPNGSSNSSLLSLVAGTITFVAGETAKHGDMKVDTPVATMGIRGTAVLTQINFVVPAGGGDPQPQASFQVLVEPNGTTGSYILFDKITLLPIATVNQAGQMIQISGGNVSISSALMSPDIQKLITDVFTLKFTDNNTNTKLTTNFTDTITQTNEGLVIKTAAGYTAIPQFVNLNQPTGTPQGPGFTATSGSRLPTAVSLFLQSLDLGNNVKVAFNLTEVADQTGVTTADVVIAKATFVDFNLGDRPTVKVVLTDGSYVYTDASQHDVTAGLSALQKQDILATEVKITVVPNSGNDNNGSTTWTFSVPDNAFDFLAAGEKLTLKYTIVLNNNFADDPGIVTQNITITITGTNDKPVITTSVPIITFEGGTSVPGGPLVSDVPTSGTLTFTDVDLTDTHSVAVTLTSATLPDDGTVPPGPLAAFEAAMSVWIANGSDSTGSGTGTINWSLADLPVYLADFIPKGEVLTLVYTVTVTDSQGATSQQTITVEITGTDAPAVVWIATNTDGEPAGGFWKDAANWATGTVPTIDDDAIVITDQLHGLTPSYPVTIDQAAYAKSLTMDDYDTAVAHKAPEVINHSTLTLAGSLTLNADAKFTNAADGTVLVGGAIDVETITRKTGEVVTSTATITNAGTFTLAAGGKIDTLTTIVNSGLIELSGGTLTLDTSIGNTGGVVKVDSGATLVADTVTVDGGTLKILGTLDLDGISLIENGTLNNSGTVNVNGAAEFAHETVSNTSGGTIRVLANGWLTIDQNSGVTNTGNVTIDTSGKLTVNGATFSGTGTLTGNGEIDLTGNAVVSGGVLKNNATFNVSGTGNALNGETITNAGTIEVLANGALAIKQNSTVDNSSGNIIVDDNAALTLDQATISGGTIKGTGGINVTAASKIDSGATLSIATVTAGAKLTLDGMTVSGTAITDNASIELDNLVKLKDGAKIQGGPVTNNGTLEIAGTATLLNDVVTNNGTVKVDDSQTLKLSGTEITGGTINNYSGLLGGTIDVTGNSKIDGNATLNKGAVTVESGVTLTLDDATVAGAAITGNGEIDLTGNAVVSGGVLKNNATFNVSGTGNALNGETITNAGTIEVLANGALAIKQSSTVDNSSGNIIVDNNAALTLDQATISGGTIKGVGAINVTAASKIDSGATLSIATVTAGAKLTLDGMTVSGTAITDNASIELDNLVKLKDGAKIQGGPVTNNGTLEIAGTATLLNDVVTNNGTVKVDDSQTLKLSGTEITGGTINNYSGLLGGTIDVTGNSKIDGNATLNKGAVTVESGVTLTLDDATVAGTAITNHGAVKVGASKKLTLSGASLSGGTLTVSGTLDSSGATTITDASVTNNGLIEAIGGLLTLTTLTSATIANAGTLQANGAELDIDHEAVTNTGTLAAINGGTLKLISNIVTNTGATVSVASDSTLDLNGAAIDGGTLTVVGTLESTGTSAINNADITNTGTIKVTSGTLTIDPAVVHTITNQALIQVSGAELDISGDLILNTANIKAINQGILKLADVTITNGGGTVTVDATSKLYLSGVTSINGGSLTNAGNLYGVSGLGTISAAVTNTGTIEVQAGTLNLSGGLSGVGSLIIDDGATLELAGATAQTITFAGGTDTLQLDKVVGQSFTGTIAGNSTKAGTFTVKGAADITTSSGDALDFTASGGAPGTPGNIVLTPTGTLTGAANGVVVTQNGTGNISLTATGNITGLAGNGIALRDGATGAGDITINNVSGKATGTGANSAGVLVENGNAANGGDISITQLGGAAGGAYGIDVVTAGNGDITVDAGGNITGSSIYGIRSRSYGSGSTTIKTEAGSVVTSGSSGVVAVNRAVSLLESDQSSITITNYGTVNSGTSLNQAASAPGGLEAGYTGSTNSASANANVYGSVVINNYGNVTAAGGYGIHAYNYGNGDVTVIDGIGTTVIGADTGIFAQALSGGTGDVTVTLGANATVKGTAGYGILAYSIDKGDVSVTLAADDKVTSGGSGIVAVNYAAAIALAAGSTISVEAHGAIHSGSALNSDGTTPGAIIAGYKPGGNSSFSNAVNGNVTVTSDATITADAGYGIEAFTWGIGDVTVTTGALSQITAAGTAIGAFDHGGGNVSVTNDGSVTGAVGLSAYAAGAGNITIVNHGHITGTSLAGISVTQNDADVAGDPIATGSTHITNSGSVVGATGYAAIFIQENATGSALIDNSGTIGPAAAATVTSTTYAIIETGGAITINNTGDINGNISVVSATFNNEAGGIWTVAGSTVFGNLSSIVNAGEIDLLDGASVAVNGTGITNSGDIDSWGTASITGTIVNTGTIEVNGGTLTLFGSLSGSGSVTIDANATLKLEGAVSQTITFGGTGAELEIDTTSFGGSIAGFAATDKLDLSSIVYDAGTSATYDSLTGDLVVSDAYGHTITVKLVGADYSNAHFAGSSDGHGGTLITYNAVDDKPAFTAAETSQSAVVAEQAGVTGSSTLDKSTPASGTIHFTDIDLTDRPTATITSQSVTLVDANHHTLALTQAQVNALENALSVLTTGKNNGAVTWSYSITDSALDFLGQGQTATVVSTITLDDHHGGTDTAQVTVNINGANDAPVFNLDHISVTQTNDEQVFVHGLSVTDVDAAANETYTLSTHTAVSDSYATPGSEAASLGSINSSLQTVTYHEGTAEPASDMITLSVTDGYGASDTIHLIFNLAENAQEHVSLTGTTGKDVFFGTAYQDQFVFAANFNHDTIVNFTSGQDHIDLSAVVTTNNVATWMASHVAASATNSADTLITIDAADTILLKGVSVSSLHASDFIVHS